MSATTSDPRSASVASRAAIERLLARCRAAGAFLSTVESCTGGLIAREITAVAGASDAFWGSFVVYDNSAKIAAAGIDARLILDHGAVSEPVARALAEAGARRMAEAMTSAGGPRPVPRTWISVSTTGVAGPGGGTPEKPVGLCFIGVARIDGDAKASARVETLRYQAPAGSREDCQQAFAEAALGALGKLL